MSASRAKTTARPAAYPSPTSQAGRSLQDGRPRDDRRQHPVEAPLQQVALLPAGLVVRTQGAQGGNPAHRDERDEGKQEGPEHADGRAQCHRPPIHAERNGDG